MSQAAAERSPADGLDRLRDALGAERVECGDASWRFSAAGVSPRSVIRPSSVEEVAEVVRVAGDAGLAVIPCGNATALEIGFPPERYDVALCSTNLNRILTHDADDMTVTVEAGMTLRGLNERLAAAGQWLPLDPANADRATIGGVISADRSGPLRLCHGKVRDLLIGLRVVRADGAVVRGGGRVVKNVAGYDLPKLFAGSFGTLGVIVEATFKVLPRPVEQRLLVWPRPSIADAVESATALLATPLAPLALEGVNDAAAETIGVASGAALLALVAGDEAEVASQEARLREHSAGAVELCPPDRAEAVLSALRDFAAPANEDALVARISILPGNLAPLLRRVECEARARQIVVEISAHLGSGVAWCQGFEATDPRSLPLFAEWMRVTTRALDGWVVFEALPEALRGRVDPWGFNEPSVRLMQRVKERLDPKKTFSPGRFVGGI